MSVWVTLTFFQSHSFMRNQNFRCPLSHKLKHRFGWNSVCCHNMLGFFKLMLILFRTTTIQGRELFIRDLMKYTFKIVMCPDTCEAICFKLGMMQNTTNLCSLIPLSMTLMFTQGHGFTGKLELVQSFCCKVVWSNSNVCDGWLCKGNYCDEVLWVWRIWIVWAFTLLVIIIIMNTDA